LRPHLIGRWQKQHAEYGQASFAGAGHTYTESAKVAELERKVGQLTMEADLLKKALLRFETRAR
jgi:transposase-like protein